MISLEKKVIWITGSSKGIGKAMALALAQKGARVVISARDEATVRDAAEQAQKDGLQVMGHICDVTDRKAVEDLVQQVVSEWGTIDILINNAGIGIFKKIVDTTEDDWDAMMQANAKSAFLCTQAVLPAMLERQSGHIINVISVAGEQPFYNSGGYCASKHAMLGFTEVLRLETRKYGLRVTAFLPGATDTDIWGQAKVDRSKMMQPEQVAEVVVGICAAPENSMVEKLILRPQGGDL